MDQITKKSASKSVPLISGVVAFVLVAAFTLVLGARPASAETCTFAHVHGLEANSWNDALNWADCGRVPGSGDDVVIPAATPATTTTMGAQPSSAAVRSITIAATSALVTGAYNISATSSVSVSGTLTINDGSVSTTALTVGAAGTVTVTTGAVSTTSMDNSGAMTFTTGSVTSTGAVTNSGTITFTDAGYLTILGSFANTGTVTLNGGPFLHAAEHVYLADSSYASASSYTAPTTMYIEVQDANQNLLGATVETVTVSLAASAAAGSDSETVTLTETSVASGIFRGTVGLATTNRVSVGNGGVEITASGSETLSYEDNQDATDTGTSSATLTYPSSTSDTGTRTGSGAVGGLASSVTPTFQSVVSHEATADLLANLSAINVAVHALVKLPNDGNSATQEDSAVYYVGSGGKRHAFPNAKVYSTWYGDFSGVTVISAEQLASIPLGVNARYRPGTRMVKFTTDPKTYAVGLSGELRWIKTEAIAQALYGADWNKKIDDIPDTFYMNYTFGAEINSASDFNVSQMSSAEANISADIVK